MGYRDNIGSLIIVLLLVLSLNRFVFSQTSLPTADSLTTDQVFSELKTLDSESATAVFTMTNPEELALPQDALKINFNEVCGRVNSYKLMELSTCYEEVPIYNDKITCQIINNKTTLQDQEICTTEKIYERTETKSYTCEKEIPYITSDTKDYTIKADIQFAKCSDGSYGYKIDWIPTLTTTKEIITQDKWAWWNTTYAWRSKINCSNIETQIPVVVNGSNGFTLNGTKMFIHTTNCNSTSNTYIYYNNNLSYTIADDFGMVAWDNPSDYPRISYENNRKAVYGSSAQSIYHLGDGNDSSYFGNNLTNYGMDYVTGLIGKAVDSETGEADDMGRTPYVTNISRAYTILTWLKPESIVNGGYWLMTYNGEGTFLLRERCVTPAGVYFESTNSSGSYAFQNFNHTKGGLSMSVGTWQLYAITYDGTTGKAWYNTTIADTSSVASQDNFNPTTLRIGYFTGASNSFDGLIDEVMIFNESWSDNQIGYYYNNTHPAGIITGYGNIETEETQTNPDTTSPNTTLVTPTNNTITGNHTQGFVFKVTDETALTLNCTLFINNSQYGTGVVNNNTNTQITPNSSIAGGNYIWQINCTDGNNYNLSETWNIIFCTENWFASYGDCNTSDLMLKSYTDLSFCNSTYGLPVDNGTGVECNYCTEDIHTQQTACIGGFQTTNYTDSNYFLCCYLTGIISDCSILYSPYNTTTRVECNETTSTGNQQTCNATYLNFTCNYDYQPIMHEKMNIVCEMPDNDDYRCVANIYQLNILLQTNPEYREASNTLFNLKGEGDTRQFFTPENRLLNAFYTPKNMRTDTDFMIQVLCTSTNKTIKSEYCITPEYESMGWVNNRLIWIKDNIVYVLIFLFVLIAVIGSLIYYAKQSARGY